ncbi:antibiotic biosynthesis monooxygenase [Luminiphilus sp.]|nr:antibiotic biosynthesis monooxygenase [Luminiphilus sp.]
MSSAMALIVRTIYQVRPSDRASFLADFAVMAQAIKASPACDWIYVVDQEISDQGPIESMSYWTSEAGFDDHLRWRLETSRWKELEHKYLLQEPDITLMPVIFRYD